MTKKGNKIDMKLTNSPAKSFERINRFTSDSYSNKNNSNFTTGMNSNVIFDVKAPKRK